jgi:hypothetical protein
MRNCSRSPRSDSQIGIGAVASTLPMKSRTLVGLLQRSAPRRIRTYDPRIRSPMLYPAELGARRNAIQVRGA